MTTLTRIAVAAGALAFTADLAFAQFGPPWQSGWWFWWMPAMRMVLVLGVIFLIAFVAFRMLRRPYGSRSAVALDILTERFARGDIDKAEYEDKRRTITRS